MTFCTILYTLIYSSVYLKFWICCHFGCEVPGLLQPISGYLVPWRFVHHMAIKWQGSSKSSECCNQVHKPSTCEFVQAVYSCKLLRFGLLMVKVKGEDWMPKAPLWRYLVVLLDSTLSPSNHGPLVHSCKCGQDR